MLPNANDLRFLLELAKTKNMSRAAERLGISQPALSMAVKRLEDCFEQQLLFRSKSGVQLTKAGELLASNSKDLLDRWQELKDSALKKEKNLSGSYRIGCHASVAKYCLKHFLPQLLTKYPELEFRFSHGLSRKITEMVVSYQIDFGIVVNPFPHPDLVIRDLFKDEVCFWKSKKTNLINDLDSEQKVLIIEPELAQTQDLMKKIGKKKINFNRVITTSNLEVLAKMVSESSGIGVLPSRVINQKESKVEKIDYLPSYTDRICLVYRADTQKAQASKRLKEELEQFLKNV